MEHEDLLRHRLDALLRDITSRHPLRQAVMAVETEDRSFRWIGGAGDSDVGSGTVTAESPFFIASIDKMLNAAVILKLSETGLIDLDNTLASYLPVGIVRDLHHAGRRDRTGEVTLRHLLSHTSGLADWLEDRPKRGRSLIERVIEGGDIAIGIEQIAEIVRGLRPHFSPQDLRLPRPRMRYSDTNYMLLIAVIEAVTEKPVHTVHEQLLYQPLGLDHTYFPGVTRPTKPVCRPLTLCAMGQPLEIPDFLQSIRAIYSTTSDMIAFMRSLVRGDLFDGPDTLDSMKSRWNRFGIPRDQAALRAPSWPIEYGLGLMRYRLPRIFNRLKPMPPVIGHTGSTGCWLFHCPSRDLFLTGGVDEVTAGAIPYRWVPRILRAIAVER